MTRLNVHPINVQWQAFRMLERTLPYLRKSSVSERALSVLSYAAIIGGSISEHNLLHLMRYVGLDLNKEPDTSAMHDALALYVGSGIINIVDNNLGIKEIFYDSENPLFQAGIKADVSGLVMEIEKNKKELLERISGRAENGQNRDS